MTDFSKIALNTLDRYTNRYNRMGKNISTLGWGSLEQQEYRFLQTLEATNFNNKSILDIGCGFADLYKFLNKSSILPLSYTGWDLNPNFIKESQSLNSSITSFEVMDISREDHIRGKHENFDIAIMLGLLNYNLGDPNLNLAFTKTLIKNAFYLVKEVLIIDFLSTKMTDSYPKEDFVFYHNPSKMLDYALSITSNTILKHNYASIPQKEFILFLYK